MTHILSNPEAIARAEAGRAAVEACHRYGLEVGAEILTGRMCAYVVACAEVFGWDQTMALIDELHDRNRAGLAPGGAS